MSIKGKARGRADQLSAHLLRQDTNEVVEIREIQGVVSQDVPGALEEMEALAAAMRSRRPLYHGVISPAADRPFTPEQLSIAIDRLEKSLELEGHTSRPASDAEARAPLGKVPACAIPVSAAPACIELPIAPCPN